MEREETVQQLLRVFRQYGYEGATLSRISTATGLGRASLYHHFPQGKKEMAAAVLDYVDRVFAAKVLQPLQSEDQPAARVAAMSASLSQFYNSGRDACLMAVFTLGESNDLFQAQVKQALSTWIEALAQVAIAAGVDAVQARQRAENAVIQIQGALVLTRSLDTTAPFERVLQELPSRLLDCQVRNKD